MTLRTAATGRTGPARVPRWGRCGSRRGSAAGSSARSRGRARRPAPLAPPDLRVGAHPGVLGGPRVSAAATANAARGHTATARGRLGVSPLLHAGPCRARLWCNTTRVRPEARARAPEFRFPPRTARAWDSRTGREAHPCAARREAHPCAARRDTEGCTCADALAFRLLRFVQLWADCRLNEVESSSEPSRPDSRQCFLPRKWGTQGLLAFPPREQEKASFKYGSSV
jgi:hypothetical protein